MAGVVDFGRSFVGGEVDLVADSREELRRGRLGSPAFLEFLCPARRLVNGEKTYRTARGK